MKLALCLTFMLATAMYADSVITATCDGITRSGSCRSEIPAGFGSTSHSNASGSVTLQLASNPADWSNLMTHQEAMSVQGFSTDRNGFYGPATEATVSIHYSQGVMTGGPQRVGYLQINLGQSGGGYFYDGHASMTSGFTIHPYDGGVFSGSPTTQIHCEMNSGDCLPGNGYYRYYNRIPVMLGTTLTLAANGSLQNQSVWIDAQSGGTLDTSFLFRFYEADGTTPVQVEVASDAPEPSTSGLIALALAAAVLLRKKLP